MTEISTPATNGPASPSIIHVAAAAHYRSEAASAADTRVLEPEYFTALGAALLTLGLIDASEIEEPEESGDLDSDDVDHDETEVGA